MPISLQWALALHTTSSRRFMVFEAGPKDLQTLPDAALVVDDGGDIIAANGISGEMFGYSHGDLVGQPIELLVPEGNRGAHRKQRETYSAAPRQRLMDPSLRLSGRRKGGDTFAAEISLGPLQLDEGMFVFCVVRDVTERLRLERKLRDSEERFELAIRGTDAGVWDWDMRSDEVFFSARWKSMLGHDDHEIANSFSEWENRLHPEDRSRSLSTIREYMDGGRSEYELEHRLRHKDGSYRWVLSRGAAMRDPSGKPYRMVGSHIDITLRKETEETLRHQEAQLLAAEEIQRHLMPQTSPDLPGFEIAGRCYPAEYAGGDQFDYLPQPDGSLILTVGDVSGHGFGPALLMACLHAHIRSLAKTKDNLSDLVVEANAALIEDSDRPYFVSLIAVQIDPSTRSLTFVNAGHPFGIVLDSKGVVKHELQSFRVPLGILEETDFPVGESIPLFEDDVLIFLTDGLVEAMSPAKELFRLENVLRVVRKNSDKSASDIVEALREAVRDHCESDVLSDDVTIVIVKVQAPPA
jgi:PAS domain S-box-containing protein